MSYASRMEKKTGKRVIDAKHGLFIEVQPRDIKRSTTKSPSKCGFAQCIKRQEYAKSATVFRTVAYVEYDDRIERFQLPPSMQKEIVAFDRNKTMVPGEYRLSPVTKASTLTEQRKPRRAAQKAGKRDGAHHIPKTTKKIHRKRTENVRTLKEPS